MTAALHRRDEVWARSKLWKSRMRNLRVFSLGITRGPFLALGSDWQVGASMELLELMPPEFGVSESGVYVVDDDGVQVRAGPFDNDGAALAWIERRQHRLCLIVPYRANAS